MTAIDAVVFDVGNVLIDWNPRYLYRKLFDGDETGMERFLADVCTPIWNAAQDAGRPFTQAVEDLCDRFPEHTDLIEAYDVRWEEMVPWAHDATCDLVHELKAQGWPLYALTNFSAEKFPLMQRRFDVFAQFDGIVVSGEIGLIKPDPAIFHHLFERFALRAEFCLFIDDSPANVECARSLGMQTIHYVDPETLREEITVLGLL
ncbi:MAG: HAD family phosphatase [Defluviicoccus sp.]|nr:MAG: HAD family phosphatase [Defluviicoccus sp.]